MGLCLGGCLRQRSRIILLTHPLLGEQCCPKCSTTIPSKISYCEDLVDYHWLLLPMCTHERLHGLLFELNSESEPLVISPYECQYFLSLLYQSPVCIIKPIVYLFTWFCHLFMYPQTQGAIHMNILCSDSFQMEWNWVHQRFMNVNWMHVSNDLLNTSNVVNGLMLYQMHQLVYRVYWFLKTNGLQFYVCASVRDIIFSPIIIASKKHWYVWR